MGATGSCRDDEKRADGIPYKPPAKWTTSRRGEPSSRVVAREGAAPPETETSLFDFQHTKAAGLFGLPPCPYGQIAGLHIMAKPGPEGPLGFHPDARILLDFPPGRMRRLTWSKRRFRQAAATLEIRVAACRGNQPQGQRLIESSSCQLTTLIGWPSMKARRLSTAISISR